MSEEGKNAMIEHEYCFPSLFRYFFVESNVGRILKVVHENDTFRNGDTD